METNIPQKGDTIFDAVFSFDEKEYNSLSEDERLNLLIVLQDMLDKQMLLLFPKPKLDEPFKK